MSAAHIRDFKQGEKLPVKTMEGKEYYREFTNTVYDVTTLDDEVEGGYNALLQFENGESLYVMNIDFDFIPTLEQEDFV